MFRRLADPDPLCNPPLHPFIYALFKRSWSAPVKEIAQEIGEEPEQIKVLVKKVLIGSFNLDEEKDIISLIMPEESGQQPLTEKQLKMLFYRNEST